MTAGEGRGGMCDLWQLRPGTGQSGTRSRVAALAGLMWAPIIQLRNKIVPAVEGCSRVQTAATMGRELEILTSLDKIFWSF